MKATTRRGPAVLGVLTLLAAVAPAWAADPTPGGTLYELTESRRIVGQRIERRTAVSALGGFMLTGSPLCPASLGAPRCFVNVIASDNLNLTTGIGPASGDFTVVLESGNPVDNPVDGPEAVVMRGALQGTIDLSTALAGIAPLGTISGTWQARGVRGGPLAGQASSGAFDGVFRLPAGAPCVTPFCPAFYFVGPTPADFVPLAPEEYALGIPTVRLDITFTGGGH